MPNNFYELIEHTADIGIRVKAKTLEELFCNAAAALFDIIAVKTGDSGTMISEEIDLEADDREELLVDWLNELLSLSAVRECIFQRYHIKELTPNHIRATATGLGNKAYEIKTEIKAATYHELKIEQQGSVWQAEVIFDV